MRPSLPGTGRDGRAAAPASSWSGGPRLSLIDVANFAFLASALAFLVVAWPRLPERTAPCAVLVLLLVGQFVIMGLRPRLVLAPAGRVALLIGVVLFVFAGFASLSYTIAYVNPHRYDAALAQLDRLVLGVSPTHWLQAWTYPVLTDIFYVFYLAYFPMPIVLVWWLLARRRYQDMERGVFVFLVCYYLGAVLYFAVPAQGPRAFLAYEVPLDGWLVSVPIRDLINALEPNKLDAFPSMHSAILVVTLIVSYWYHRRLFHVYAWLSIGILVSLLYCRYHYVVDVVAGAAVAAFAGAVGGWAYDRWRPRFAAHFQPARTP
jgi:membrane-associated phospholipid phosphatase